MYEEELELAERRFVEFWQLLYRHLDLVARQHMKDGAIPGFTLCFSRTAAGQAMTEYSSIWVCYKPLAMTFCLPRLTTYRLFMRWSGQFGSVRRMRLKSFYWLTRRKGWAKMGRYPRLLGRQRALEVSLAAAAQYSKMGTPHINGNP